MAERKLTERGKFYTFALPAKMATLVPSIDGVAITINTQFSIEELMYLRRAREALAHPAVLASKAKISDLRNVRVPWGITLGDRKNALEELGILGSELIRYSDGPFARGFSDELITTLRIAKDNVLPFLPHEEPAKGEQTAPSRRER